MQDLTGPMKKVYFFIKKQSKQIAVVISRKQGCKYKFTMLQNCVKELAIADSEHGLVNN